MLLLLKSVAFASCLAAFAQSPLLAQADFSLSPSPTSQTVWQAQSTNYIITVTAINGFTGTVTFAATGLPTGATASFNPVSVAGSGTTTMTVAASAGTPTGSSTLTVTGTSNPLTHNTTVSLNVVVPPPINYTYDAAGRLTSVTDQFGQSAIYSYDSVGNLLSISRQSTNQLTISTFAPSSGLAGAVVSILGSGFSSTPAQNTVKFNGVTATVTSSSNTQIVTTVPVGATTGTISVQNANGTATSSSSFTVLSAPSSPTISSISPTLAPSATPLTITGTNFFTSTASNTVKVGPTVLNVLSATATTIGAISPTVVSSGKITVQTPSGLATSGNDFISVPAPFRLVDLVLSQRAAPGTNYAMNFTASGQAGVLIFDATTPGQIFKLLSNSSVGTTKLTLFGPDGAVLMNDVGLNSSGNAIATPALSVGTYTVLVKGPVTGVFIGTPSLDLGKTTLTIANAPGAGDFAVSAVSELFQGYWPATSVPYYQPNYKSGQRFKIYVTMGSSLAVSLSMSGLPSGVTFTLSPPSMSNDGLSVLEFIVPTSLAAGTYPVTVTGTAGALTRTTTVQLNVVPPPSPWVQTAVNTVGRAEYSGGVFTIYGGGSGNGNVPDAFHMVSQPLGAVQPSGPDGSITARVTGIDYAPAGFGAVTAYAGVMIRESLNPGAKAAYLRLRTDGGAEFQWNTGTGTGTTVVPGIPAPYWLKLARQGTNFIALISPDGTTWTQVGSSVAITMSAASIGVAANADTYGNMAQATFDNVTLNTAPDFLLTAPPTLSVIPGQSVNGSTTVNALNGFNGLVTFNAAGLPPGANASFTPPSVTGPNSSTISITTTAGTTPLGVFPITITGTGPGPVTRKIVVTLITGPDFTISVSPATRTTNISTPVTYTLTVTFLNGLTQPVVLTAAGVPPAATSSFSPAQLTTNGTSTFTVNIGATTPSQTYTLTIVGKSGTIVHTATATVIVSTTGFSVSANPPALSFPSSGGQATSTVTASIEPPASGFNKTVTFSVTGLPPGASASFNPTPPTALPGVPVIMTVTMPAGLASGNYQATLVGTSIDPSAGNPAQSTALPLIVNASGSLPSGWSSQDIGGPSYPPAISGSAGFSGSTFTVQASGTSLGTGTGSAFDSFRYVYQTLNGAGSIIASVPRLQNVFNGSVYGLMIRETLDPGSRQATMAIFQDTSPTIFRTYLGSRGNTGGPFGWNFQSAGPTLWLTPTWLKVVRVGDLITGYQSGDGITWVTVASATLSGLPSSVYIGLAVSSATQSNLTTADFFDVTVLGAAPDFDLTTSAPYGRTISTAGGSTYNTLRITGVNAFSGTSTIGVGGLPPGATYNLSSSTVAAGGYANLQLTLPSGLAPGPYPVTVTATSGSLTHSLVITPTVSASGGLLAPWAAEDIGPMFFSTNSSTLGATAWSTFSSGDQISGTSEVFRYTYQALNGDGTMVVRLKTFSEHYPFPVTRVGIMMRETLEPDSANAFMSIRDDGSHYPAFQYRSTKAGSSIESTALPNTVEPTWLKLQRVGNQFTGYFSNDGVNWGAAVGTMSIPMPATGSGIYVGLATTSGYPNGQTTALWDSAYKTPSGAPDFLLSASPATQTVGVGGGSAYFSAIVSALNGLASTVNLSVTGLPAGATSSTPSIVASGFATLQVNVSGTPAGTYPVAITAVSGAVTHSVPATLIVSSAGGATLPGPWAHMDIGAVGVQGNTSQAGGAYTVQGSGNYIFYAADAFHYAYQPLSGDGTIIAHVASTQNFSASTTAKAGVMIRETLTPDSKNVLITLHAANGWAYQARTTSGSTDLRSYGSAGSAGPPWMKLTRSGNIFTAYQSSDGIAWSSKGTYTIPMVGPVYIGLAVSAEDNSCPGSPAPPCGNPPSPPSRVTTGVFDNVQVSTVPDYRISATPTSSSVAQGSGTPFTVTVDPLNGFNGAATPVSFQPLSGNPAGVTGTFAPTQWSGSGNVSLTVNVGASVPVGSYPMTITGTSGALTHTTVVTLNVTLPVAPTPTFSPAAGLYTSAQSVTISSTGASIRYTTDGTDPTPTTGTLYTAPVSVATTQTLKAIAYRDGWTPSPVASAAYTIIIRTARGAFQDKTSTAAWTAGNVTVASGEALFVVVGGNAGTLPTVTWGGTALVQDNSLQTGTTAAVAVYSLLNPTPGTQSLVITWSGAIPGAKACVATTVTGLLTSSAKDTNVAAKNGNITSGSPSTGPSGTSAQAREFIMAGVLTLGPIGDTAGTATTPFSLGQRQGTTGQSASSNVTVQELYNISNSVSTYTAAKTGMTSRTWWAIEQGYKAQ